MAACDDYRYGLLGCTEIPDKRTDNLAAALNELRLVPPETPSPLNLFANLPWEQDGGLTCVTTSTNLPFLLVFFVFSQFPSSNSHRIGWYSGRA